MERPKPSTTPHRNRDDGVFRVTHPFHPLFGRTYESVIFRRNWGEDRVYFYNAEGRLISLPAQWTSAVAEEPIITMAAGRSHFRVEDLLKLVCLLKDLNS